MATTAIGAAVAVFVVAALLYYQASATNEHFQNLNADSGRWYGAFPDTEYDVPPDLDKAPVTTASSAIPGATGRPASIPGPATAPKEAPAQRRDLNDLDNKISVWLDAAAQQERERSGSLTSEQLQRRIMLQGRQANIRTQLGTNVITDTYKTVAEEIAELQRENHGWQQPTPNLEAAHGFARGLNPDNFLGPTLYKEFRGLFDAGLAELQNFLQPDPLQRVRLQQLQVIRQELLVADRRPATQPPPIRVGQARLFLQQMLRPDQPLPSLFSLDAPTATPAPLSTSPTDILSQLRDLQWRLTVTYNPAEQELQRSVAALLDRVQKGGPMSVEEMEVARQRVVEMQEQRAPAAFPGSELIPRARRLCRQMEEAFPGGGAQALGCPATIRDITDTYQAESAINTVCSRLRTSVPTVSPAQFGCPRSTV